MKPYKRFKLGKLHTELGWFPGEDAALFSLRLVESSGLIIQIKIIKLLFYLGWY